MECYNGKEMETFNNFETLAYGARMYDLTIGRWNVVDSLAERHPNMSQYTFCANNPIKFIYPDGRDLVESSN